MQRLKVQIFKFYTGGHYHYYYHHNIRRSLVIWYCNMVKVLSSHIPTEAERLCTNICIWYNMIEKHLLTMYNIMIQKLLRVLSLFWPKAAGPCNTLVKHASPPLMCQMNHYICIETCINHSCAKWIKYKWITTSSIHLYPHFINWELKSNTVAASMFFSELPFSIPATMHPLLPLHTWHASHFLTASQNARWVIVSYTRTPLPLLQLHSRTILLLYQIPKLSARDEMHLFWILKCICFESVRANVVVGNWARCNCNMAFVHMCEWMDKQIDWEKSK